MQAAPLIATGLQAGTSILGGMAGKAEAQGEVQRANTNAYIARTRAIQTGAAATADLNDEMATMRATMASNGEIPGVGSFEIMRKLGETRLRERRIAVGNEKQVARDWDTQAKNSKAKGNAALALGIGGAAQPMFDLYQLSKKKA